jgi:hypothetical protein
LLRRFHDDMWVRKDLEAALKCASPQLQIDWSASTAPSPRPTNATRPSSD